MEESTDKVDKPIAGMDGADGDDANDMKNVSFDASVGSPAPHRIQRMFKPLQQEPLTLAEATKARRRALRCNHRGKSCTCERVLGRNKQIRSVDVRNAKRDAHVEEVRGDMMDFVFEREQLREKEQMELQCRSADEFVAHFILDDCEADFDADFDSQYDVNDDQLLAEEYAAAEQLELAEMLDSLSFS